MHSWNCAPVIYPGLTYISYWFSIVFIRTAQGNTLIVLIAFYYPKLELTPSKTNPRGASPVYSALVRCCDKV
jgi:hypothetical protein